MSAVLTLYSMSAPIRSIVNDFVGAIVAPIRKVDLLLILCPVVSIFMYRGSVTFARLYLSVSYCHRPYYCEVWGLAQVLGGTRCCGSSLPAPLLSHQTFAFLSIANEPNIDYCAAKSVVFVQNLSAGSALIVIVLGS
ncbi:hypothetical protein Pmar_PMAR021727 [Perkinsus marinus ATCC 50983]|uniref:Uncharacterized protein n=1 Tax=Perkinsus marinus (strain ATCC 50983 / TXsc) TaxID=423536 RepID=C5L2I3_PERM5|nr:hypothetical protein Pmar_PMAR021727 [Perkinsus marinus ATCC 50983]EER09077.1 hypothetical protein Pmar_PMAR021727 [Perkinsus marinus ATCC 50983]|eukprot:XP_002777261.1 hypothetical protein Pmar_PMAR021727 [Perkinsus marinus ATCC 50983]